MKLDYTRHYLKWHKNTAAHRDFVSSHYRDLLGSLLPKNPEAWILDVGCGIGLALGFLKASGFKNIEGVDTDAGQINLARQADLPAKLVADTTKYLSERKGSSDCVLCLDVLEHIPKAEQIPFLCGIFGVLKPQGRLILTVPNANSALAMRWRHIDWTHETSFTEHSLDFVLFHAGFQKITVSPAEFVRRPKWFFLPVSGGRHWWAFCFFRLFRRLEMMAELGPEQGRQVPLSLNLLAVAEREG
jgi:2-polyprenyl-3-methyl-5-hydroxy-6-metoxy-1,4-benzoquinol methylase